VEGKAAARLVVVEAAALKAVSMAASKEGTKAGVVAVKEKAEVEMAGVMAEEVVTVGALEAVAVKGEEGQMEVAAAR